MGKDKEKEKNTIKKIYLLEFDEKENCFINCRKTPGKPIFVVYFNTYNEDGEDSWKLGRLHIDFEDLDLDFYDDYKIYATKDNLQKICDFINEIDIDYIETYFDQIYGDDMFFGNDGF